MRLKTIILTIKEKQHLRARKKENAKKREMLKNKNITLISCNCVGCCMLNDLGLRYNSPFVNLYLEASDFIKYLKSPQYYNSQNLNFIKTERYPVAFLADIKIYFVHYKNEEEAKESWERRIQRMDFTNPFVIFSDREGCTHEMLKEFDSLPYKNKVVFTHLPNKDIKTSFYVKGFEDDECVGNLIRWKPKSKGKRYYDDFDYVAWFNGN